MNIGTKVLNKILAKQIRQKDYTPWSNGIYSRNASLVQHSQISKYDSPHKKMKDKNHMIISIAAEKAFDKIQYEFMINTVSKVRLEGTYRIIIKAIHIWQTHGQHHTQQAKTTSILLTGNRQGCLLSPLLFNIVLEVLATAIRKEGEIKGIHIEKEEVKLSLFADDMIVYIGWVQQGSRREN